MSGAVPPPAARPLERAARVPRPVCPGCGRWGRGDPAPAPQRAPLRAGIARCGGGGRASPGGVPFHHCERRLRSGAVPPPTARPLGGLLGSATHVLWARVCGCGGPTLSAWPACPVDAACRGAAGGPSPGGVACHGCEGRPVSGAVPPPAARPLERAAGVPRPVCPGFGRCGRGDPAPAPQRAPLRAGVARCGGGGRASPGGVPSAVVRGVCGQVLPLPGLLALWACCLGPSPTCHGCGCVGVGAQHCPLGLHALWVLRAVGLLGGRPRGGWPATVVRGVRCQALSLPWPPVLWGGQPGFRNPCVPGAVGLVGETQHRPHGARPCGPALRAVGVAEGRPRGGGSVRRCEGRLGSGAPPPRAARPLGGPSGFATHVLWARVCGRGGPAPAPRPACPVGACAPRGWRGASGFMRPLFPAARPLGGLPGPAGRVPWLRVWVSAVCVVPVRCVPWCWVLPFACPSGAPLSDALLWCCAPRVLAVPPSLRASLVRLLATSRFLRGFFVLYPFLCPPLACPPPWLARFPCLRPGVCLGLSPCLLSWPRFSGPLLSFLLGPVRQREDWGVWAYWVTRLGNILALVSLPMLAPLLLRSPSRGT